MKTSSDLIKHFNFYYVVNRRFIGYNVATTKCTVQLPKKNTFIATIKCAVDADPKGSAL